MAEGFHLSTAAGTLVGLAGAMHIAIGVDALATEVNPLPVLFVLWGGVAIVGVAATAFGIVPRRIAYLGGVALLVFSLVGYVDVYALGVSESVLGVEWHPPESSHSHDGPGSGRAHSHGGTNSSDASIFEGLASGHYALPSKVVELTGLGLLLLLLGRE